MRQCKQCGFQVDADTVEELRQMSEHLTVHNPSPEQWRVAYHRMQRSKETGKPCECVECRKEKG